MIRYAAAAIAVSGLLAAGGGAISSFTDRVRAGGAAIERAANLERALAESDAATATLQLRMNRLREIRVGTRERLDAADMRNAALADRLDAAREGEPEPGMCTPGCRTRAGR